MLRRLPVLLLCSFSLFAAHAEDRRVTVLGRADDARIAAVNEAVAFWNQELAKAGSADRLRVDAVKPNPVPDSYFLETGADHGLQKRRAPQEMFAIEGDIVIALADVPFVSFTARLKDGRKFIGLRALDTAALKQPGVGLNIAAHEIGHALGIRHNDDPSNLMCGAPAPCHPDRFAEAKGAIFPLRDEDRAAMLTPPQAPNP